MAGNAHGQGSSPLARGLPVSGGRESGHEGIIPARAGFTRHRARRTRVRRDHPRSRGVYGDEARAGRGVCGSSPLARGLRMRCACPFHSGGIIPARAGFTQRQLCGLLRPPDHPRSRGVYAGIDFSVVPADGSSPLARGLPGTRLLPASRGGIIPARAGFTSPPGRRAGAGRDHPRSRGVYLRSTCIIRSFFGSSPLARGLPTMRGINTGNARIIPARAGFTPGVSPNDLHHTDHPRSRGVYGLIPRARTCIDGSSPLARGLLILIETVKRMSRIIPARAGFT